MVVWLYALSSVVVVSLISLIGVFTLSIKQEKLEKVLIYLVSLSTGTLLGDAFVHLIPDAYAQNSSQTVVALNILSGMLVFFVLEKYVHWRHCHHLASPTHPHPFSMVILVGDGLHNFIDGLIIAASFLVSIPIGIATTIAVVFHEIPHEIGNFGSLIYGGITRKKALIYNFLSGLMAVLGAVAVLLVSIDAKDVTAFLVPFAAGGFIYVASADLIPELHKNTEVKKTIGQIFMLLLGIGIMLLLLNLE
ncbi:ZIP family metal transporter [Patescibacteria group bacterium]|nr:MAG: ZIP family metal transporter [Patescibacteria group bacterium]